MTGLRRMKWITFRATVLNEDHRITTGAEPVSKFIEAPYDLIRIVARRRKQALLDIDNQETAFSHGDCLRPLEVDRQALPNDRYGVGT